MKLSYRAATLFCLSITGTLFSQQQTPSVPAPEQLSMTPLSPAAAKNLILDVVVTDRSGKPTTGLNEKDFTVRDNGTPQKILSFRAVSRSANAPAEPPVKIILMVDEVNTSFNRVAYERDQLKKFLLQNGGKLTNPVSMAFFSDTGTDIQNGSSLNGNALLADFDQHATALRTIRRSTGFYGAEERLNLSLKTLGALTAKEAQNPGRKIVVWISPGWPILSGPRINLSAKEEQGLFSTIVWLSTALRQSRITLYSIDPLGVEDAASNRVFYYQEFLKPVSSWKNAQAGNLALQVLARQSGGKALNSSNDITAQINQCVEDADAFYTLTLEATPSDQANQYHSLEVKVEAPGLTPRTRNGYYGQP